RTLSLHDALPISHVCPLRASAYPRKRSSIGAFRTGPTGRTVRTSTRGATRSTPTSGASPASPTSAAARSTPEPALALAPPTRSRSRRPRGLGSKHARGVARTVGSIRPGVELELGHHWLGVAVCDEGEA